jgi:hypothetical protein
MKIVCHTSRRKFSKRCILVLPCLDICYRSPPTTHIEIIDLHMVHFTTVVSSKLTSCINGNSTFNESLKLHFCFFENMLYCRGDQALLVYDATAVLITHRQVYTVHCLVRRRSLQFSTISNLRSYFFGYKPNWCVATLCL